MPNSRRYRCGAPAAASRSGRGETVDWARAAVVARQGNMILAGGLNVDNIADAIEQVRPWGVDVSSGVELRPGVKDPARVCAFIRAGSPT